MPDISHLLSDGDPDFLPKPVVLEDDAQFMGAGGIKVARSGDDVIFSGTESTIQQGVVADPQPITDPLRYMSFRARTVITPDGLGLDSPEAGDPAIHIQTGYVNSLYWEDAWIHESYRVQEDYIAVTAWPKYLYLKFPVKFISGKDTPDLTFPESSFSSAGATINGGEYFFIIDYSTGLLVRNQATQEPDFRYFVLTDDLQTATVSTAVPGSDNDFTGFFYFLIGQLNTETDFQQIHMGVLDLPQSYVFNLNRLVVTT